MAYQRKSWADERIEDIADRVVSEKLGFRILYGSLGETELTVANKNTESGVERFDRLMSSVMTHKPAVVTIELYLPTEKSFQKNHAEKHRFEFRFESRAETITGGLSGVSLDAFGGLQGIMERQQMLAGTTALLDSKTEKIEEYKELISDFKSDIRSCKEKNEALTDKIGRLKDENKNNEYKLERQQERHEDEVKRLKEQIKNLKDDFERRRVSSDRLLTIGGTVAANIMGVDEEQVSEFLGFAPGVKKAIKTDNEKLSVDIDEGVDFEESEEEYTGKKSQADNIRKSLNDWMKGLIKDNSDDNALSLLISIRNVNQYLADSFENMQAVLEFIAEQSQNKQSE